MRASPTSSNRISPGVRLEKYWGALDDGAANELRETVADRRDRDGPYRQGAAIGSLASFPLATPSSDLDPPFVIDVLHGDPSERRRIELDEWEDAAVLHAGEVSVKEILEVRGPS